MGVFTGHPSTRAHYGLYQCAGGHCHTGLVVEHIWMSCERFQKVSSGRSVYHHSHCYTEPWAHAVHPYYSASVDSACGMVKWASAFGPSNNNNKWQWPESVGVAWGLAATWCCVRVHQTNWVNFYNGLPWWQHHKYHKGYRSHRSTTYIDAAYRPSSMVCQSLCLSVGSKLCKNSSTIRDAIWVEDSCGSKY